MMDPNYGRSYTLAQGWLYPERNATKKIALKLKSREQAMGAVMPFVKRHGTAVQAGGHCGMWADGLVNYGFHHVHTFEPDIRNFTALAYNLKGRPNVYAYRAALGDRTGTASIVPGKGMNSGGMHVDPSNEEGGGVRVVPLDSLGLEELDLLMLDVEGFEAPAINGAERTIKQHRPVVVLERCSLSERYGIRDDTATNILKGWGYMEAAKIGRHDVVLVPDDRPKPWVGAYILQHMGLPDPVMRFATEEEAKAWRDAPGGGDRAYIYDPHGEHLPLGTGWQCPINYPGCTSNCGNYGCGN